jgi:hypothetical protein
MQPQQVQAAQPPAQQVQPQVQHWVLNQPIDPQIIIPQQPVQVPGIQQPAVVAPMITGESCSSGDTARDFGGGLPGGGNGGNHNGNAGNYHGNAGVNFGIGGGTGGGVIPEKLEQFGQILTKEGLLHEIDAGTLLDQVIECLGVIVSGAETDPYGPRWKALSRTSRHQVLGALGSELGLKRGPKLAAQPGKQPTNDDRRAAISMAWDNFKKIRSNI